MADKRINALANTASSTASDDFIAVDGTTNGTRKLNAFSPTFGGNATVTGTLTGNSTATIAGRVISNASSTATDAAGFAHTTGYSSGGKTYTGFSAGGIAVNQSAAFGYVYDSGTPANSFAHITPYGSTEGSLLKFSPAGVLTLGATTASTTTSSGALVVSGGVGVAKSLNVGEAVTVAGGSFAAASFYKSASLGTVLSGATGSSYDLYLTNPAGNYVMQVPTGTRNAEFAATLTTVGAITSGASISTSAPVGGAGAWELGTYSSTAPSATGYVTIEIGGTVYKLLASNV